MAEAPAPFGPLPDHPELDAMAVIVYGSIRTPSARTPISDVWLVIRSLVKAARGADEATCEEMLEALSAAIGELIADLPAERQATLVQAVIHEAFQFAGHLRTQGFDQPHGMAGHA